MGSRNEKVGNEPTAQARKVTQTNQGTHEKNFLRTFRKSHFHGRWSYSGGAQGCSGSGSKSENSGFFNTAFVPDVRIPTLKFSNF